MSQIKIFTKKNCPKCDHLKGILKDVNVKVSIHEIEKPENLAWMNGRGYVNVPVLAIYNDKGEELIIPFGFVRSNLANKFKSHTGGELFG